MGCRELEPMGQWIKGGEGEGCRPCRVPMGIGQYRKVLEDAGQIAAYETVSKALQAEGLTAGEDIMVNLAVAYDQVKAAVPPEVRAKLESIDCEIQKREECGLCATPTPPVG